MLSGGVVTRPSVTDHSISGRFVAWATSRTMADGPRLVGRLHRDDRIAGLDEQFEAVERHAKFLNRGDCPNFRGHRPGTDAERWSAMVGENGTVPFNGGEQER